MGWVASTLYTTWEHGVPSVTTADAHTSETCHDREREVPLSYDAVLLGPVGGDGGGGGWNGTRRPNEYVK